MAEAIAFLGTAGAVANILDILGKTISTIHELRQQWKQADFTLLNLIAQLTALKAALGKIKEWTDQDLVDQHHQLVMDLDVSLTCCRMLVAKVDTHISEVQPQPDGSLATAGKFKLVFGASKMEELQKMIDRQTNTLTLLLTACNV